MIDLKHGVSITRQAELLGISRAAVYYAPRPIPEEDLELQRRIDELHLEHPFAGSRTLKKLLVREGHMVGRKYVATLMRRMGIEVTHRVARVCVACATRNPWDHFFPRGLRGRPRIQFLTR